MFFFFKYFIIVLFYYLFTISFNILNSLVYYSSSL